MVSLISDVLTGTLGHPDPLRTGDAVALHRLGADPDPRALLRLRVDDHDVADVDRRLDGLDAAGLRTAAGLADLGVALHPLDALDDDALALDVDLEHPALLALVPAGDDDHEVALLDTCHLRAPPEPGRRCACTSCHAARGRRGRRCACRAAHRHP